jgi:hypothetical protein
MRLAVKVSRGRTVGFRALAGILGALVVALSVPIALGSFVDESQAIHVMHNVGPAIMFGGLVGPFLLVAAWRPSERIVAFRVTVAVALGGVIAGAASGDLVAGGWLIPAVAVGILWALHPARADVFPSGPPAIALVALPVLAAVPGIAWALTQAELQRNGLPAVDPHAQLHHYSGSAWTGIEIPLVALGAAFPARDARFARWWIGASVAALGLAALALSGRPGAFAPFWAWLAIAGGILYVGAAELAPKGRS